MEISFKGKSVVVTGGSEGIGLAIAQGFLEAGAKLAICGRSQAKLDAALEHLGGSPDNCLASSADVSNREQIFAFADLVEESFGGIDVWVSNAGIFLGAKIVETTEEQWQRVMDVNLKSIYYGGIIAQQKMGQRGGVLINAASFSSVIPALGGGVYAASKAGVVSMTRSLAAELAPQNIRVVGFIPGVIDTPLLHDLVLEKGDFLASQTALARVGQPQDLVGPVLFLASEAASYVTGTCFEVSGGKFCVQNPGQAW
jgi:3-oxoacyl-[acyl-carrier protein] reductase